MIEVVICFFAMFGLAFLIKESDGPWGIMAWIRNTLIRNKYVGVFFFNLFDCYFCVGCHCGWAVYLLSHTNYKIQSFTLWALSGGAISLILGTLLARLRRE